MRTYTKQQVQDILALYKDGKTKREIAEAYGTDIKSVQNLIYYHTIQVPQKERAKTVSITVGGVEVAKVPAGMVETKEPAVKIVEKLREMTPREMIKKLYDIGYRIEDNQLVCYVKQPVNVKDIITNG